MWQNHEITVGDIETLHTHTGGKGLFFLTFKIQTKTTFRKKKFFF
jgi:hypothetical protein